MPRRPTTNSNEEPDLRKPRKVLYYDPTTYSAGVGGSFVSLFHLVNYLDRSRYKPVVIFSRENSYVSVFRNHSVETLLFDEYFRNSTINRLFIWSDPPLPLRLLRKLVHVSRVRRLELFLRKELPHYLRMRQLIREQEIALVHSNAVLSDSLAALFAAQAERVPFVCHFRKFHRLSQWERRIGRRVDCAIAISEAVGEFLEEQEFRPKTLLTVYNGLDPDRIREKAHTGPALVRNEFGWGEDHFVVGMFGTATEWKGQDVFLKAVAIARKRLVNLRALVVGGPGEPDGHYWNRLTRYAQESGIDSITRFTGFRMDVYELMGGCSVIVHASTKPEPFGRVIAEAQVAGACVIAADAGGAREIVRDGETGILVHCGDPEALAQAIVRIYQNREEAERIRVQASREAAVKFDATERALEIQGIYDKILRK